MQVFEPLDRILANYAQRLKDLGMDLHAVFSELGANSLVEAAMRGAALGQVAGGFGAAGKTFGGINAVIQAGAEAERKLALLQRREEVMDQAKFMTYRKVAEYLETVMALPECLLDYGCAKCFGGMVSLERQRMALEAVRPTIVRELEPAVRLTLELPKAEMRAQQQRLDAAKAQQQQESHSNKRSFGQGFAFLAVSVGMILWGLKSCNLDSATEGDMVWGLVLLVCAFFALVAGIMKVFGWKPKGQGTKLDEQVKTQDEQ